jgi:hypothetical protein
MRVKVSLDFDILIESFISLCIIETVGAIFREYKPWIVLLITQWSKSSKMLALSSGLFDLQGLLPFIIGALKCKTHPQLWMYFDIPYQMTQLASSLPFPYWKRQTTLLQTFGIPEISQTFYPFYKKCKI